ncbi:MAG TPA: methyltransferase domain-containing protein [Acidimicrobiia bacterium]|nr:methyltransferase domain-containing protein [Acidimicrobiia bacterium]
MGKQSRRKRERSPAEARTERYLSRAGLPDRPDPGRWRRLVAAEPDWFRRIREADEATMALTRRGDVLLSEDGRAELLAADRARYGLVYRDLDTALAEYAARPVMIAAAWLRWWFEHRPPAGRLLDVGCGPGVLTCAYALALPEAEVVGIDAVPEAVACAGELAKRLGAGNASFVVGDAADPATGGGGFDQLVAVTALADAGLYPYDPPEARRALSSMADVDGPGLRFRSPGVDALVGRLAAGGSLLAFDRTPDVSQAVRFGAALLHAGVELDLRRAGVELFVEDDQPTTFTRFVGRRPEGTIEAAPARPPAGGPAAGGPALAAWLKRVRPPAYGPEWHDELHFEALKSAGARLVWGCEIDYSPRTAALERREIWEDGDGAAWGWIATTPRHRELVAGRAADELIREYHTLAARLAAAGLAVRYYDE